MCWTHRDESALCCEDLALPAFGNAWRSQPQRKVLNYRNGYIAIAVGMLATISATAVIAIAAGFSHLTIWTEVALIGFFAVFWVLQTIELWTPGLRIPAQ
jgi:hypothetical protein